tara:strand:+ start:76344 stop:76472 length:129 start_codon:yes stop_codon:yes gene_type:complete
MHNKNRNNEDVWVTRLQNGDKKAFFFSKKNGISCFATPLIGW